MTEHLGLGIVLSLEDNFTPQANKALGSFERLQAGAEKMQQNVNKSMSNLQQVLLSGYAFDTIGDKLQNMGRSVVNTFASINKAIVETGSKFDTAKAQLITVFRSVEEAQKKMDWAMNFSIKTPFTFDQTVESLQRLQSQGLDVTKTFKNASGEMVSFLQFVGDLATRNMGATGGINNMAYAISEAWAGQYRSLINRFNLTKRDIEGLKKYAGVDEVKFMEEFTKLANKYTPNAMKNMLGTWQQIVAEMQDTWDVFLYKLGNEGVFDSIKMSLKKISITMGEIFNNEKLVKSLKTALTDLWKPIDKLVDLGTRAVKVFSSFASEHPKLIQLGLTIFTVGGAMSYLAGTLFKTIGFWMMMSASVLTAINTMKLISGLEVGGSLMNITTNLMGLVKWIGIATVAVGAFALAWSNNFMGIRDRGLTVFNQLKEAWSMSSVYFDKDFNTKYKKQLDMEIKLDDSGAMRKTYELAEKIAKFRALGMGLFKALFGGKKDGKIFFTDEEIQAFKNTGVLETVQRLVMLRGRLDSFFEGFSKGLAIALDMGKNFIKAVLSPIEALLKAIGVHIEPIKTFFRDLFGLGGEVPLPKDKAEQQIAKWKQIGEAVGKVFGAVMGFKAITGITSFLVKPFVSMSQKIGEVGNKLNKLFGKKHTIQVESDVKAPKTGFLEKYFHIKPENKEKAKAFLNEVARVPTDNRAPSKGAYQRLYKQDIDSTYLDYKLNFDKDVNTRNLYTDNRPKWMKKLFGEKYYNEVNGEMKQVGAFGGFFRVDRNDNQIKLATQRYLGMRYDGQTNTLPKVSPLYMSGYKDKDGNKIDFDFNNPYDRIIHNDSGKVILNPKWKERQAEIDDVLKGIKKGEFQPVYSQNKASFMKSFYSHLPDMDTKVGHVEDLFGTSSITEQNKSLNMKFNKWLKSRQEYLQSTLLKDINGEGGTLRQFNYTQNELKAKNRKSYLQSQIDSSLGITRMESKSKRKRNILDAFHAFTYEDAIEGVRNRDDFKNERERLRELTRQPLYKAKRNKLATALFGDKFYTVGQREDGTLYENVVARRGGLFRLGKQDMVFHEEGDTSLKTRTKALRSRISSSKVAKPFKFVGRVGRDAFEGGKLKALQIRDTYLAGAHAFNSGYGQNLALRGAHNFRTGGFFGRIKGFSQYAMGSLLSHMPKLPTSFKDVGAGAKGFWGRTKSIGRGIGRGVGFVGRGIGAVGGFAMRALPFAMGAGALGLTAFQAIKAKGEGDFIKGLKAYQAQIKNIKFDAMWNNLKKTGKEAWNIIKDIGGHAWNEIKKNSGTIMRDAWNGIKGLASLAWTWIKNNGMDMLGTIGKGVVTLIGDAFNWLGKNAGKIFGGLATFVIGVAIPSIIKGVIGLGKFIITHLPSIFMNLVSIAGGIFEGLFIIVKGVFKGIGNFLWETIKTAFLGLGNILVRALSSTIRAVPVIGNKVADFLHLPSHHGGLFMSPDEHMAVIRKDETVLPPSISKKFNDAFKNMNSNTQQPKPTAQNVDNSIRIDKVEVVVQADSLSRSDARKQALMILEELEKIKKEKQIRAYAY